jgi:hypothetical protein
MKLSHEFHLYHHFVEKTKAEHRCEHCKKMIAKGASGWYSYCDCFGKLKRVYVHENAFCNYGAD